MLIDNATNLGEQPNTDPVPNKKPAITNTNIPASKKEAVNTDTYHEYAGFWIRVVASIIDTICIVLITIPFVMPFINSEQMPVFLAILANYILPVAFIIGFWKYKAATPGKLLLGLKIVSLKDDEEMTTAQMIIRYIGYIPSALIFLLGYIWVAFDGKKQGLHDKLAGTTVIKTR